MQQGLVISDLHLFSRRSDAEELLAGIKSGIIEADVLVLNGDVFDFRWSTLADMRTTIDASLKWLDELIALRPDKPTHYLLGNHDCITGFTDQLPDFARTRPLFTCHDTFLRLGRNLFLHGDCANRRMDGNSHRRFRESWSRDKQRGPIGRKLYDVADTLGVSRKFHDLWFPQRVTVRRVAHHLDLVLPGWRNEIDHCYFGHTHLPFTRHDHEGVLFHNTGSAIRDMGFQPLPFTCPAGMATT
jgi:UDP-2,3-diacylglucosamine hydrolase